MTGCNGDRSRIGDTHHRGDHRGPGGGPPGAMALGGRTLGAAASAVAHSGGSQGAPEGRQQHQQPDGVVGGGGVAREGWCGDSGSPGGRQAAPRGGTEGPGRVTTFLDVLKFFRPTFWTKCLASFPDFQNLKILHSCGFGRFGCGFGHVPVCVCGAWGTSRLSCGIRLIPQSATDDPRCEERGARPPRPRCPQLPPGRGRCGGLPHQRPP